MKKTQQPTIPNHSYWFDAMTQPVDVPQPLLKQLCHITLESCNQQAILDQKLPDVIRKDKYPRMIFLTVIEHEQPAKIVYGSGLGFAASLKSSLEKIFLHTTDSKNIIAIKMDIVQKVTHYKNHPIKKAFIEEIGTIGLAFKESNQPAFLPDQILANNIINKKGLIRPRNIEKYAKKINKEVPFCSDDNCLNLYRFSVISAFQSETQFKPMYRGHALYSELSPELLKQSMIDAADYLKNCVQADGKFLYEYFPKLDKFSHRYNILRHAGAVYAMLEVYEVTKNRGLLESAKTALEYLIKQAKPIKLHNRQVLCIIENEYVKLGANALAILAITKYISLTEKKNYLPVAKKLALYIKSHQNKEGEFTIHKQHFATQKATDFVSEYYPGEAILSLARLYQIDKDEGWLDTAVNAALFIIDSRAKNIKNLNLPHDHWLLYGLNELQNIQPNDKYIDHIIKLCKAIISKQIITSYPPDHLGGFYSPPRSAPTATRSEGMCAVYRILHNSGYQDEAEEILASIKLCVRFQVQTQFKPESAMYLHHPEKALGGFHRSLIDYGIRIDYVQHNISSLLGLYRILGFRMKS